MENDFEGLGADQHHSFDFSGGHILWALGRFERDRRRFQAGGLARYRQPVQQQPVSGDERPYAGCPVVDRSRFIHDV
jgi:hypothetical protein